VRIGDSSAPEGCLRGNNVIIETRTTRAEHMDDHDLVYEVLIRSNVDTLSSCDPGE